ncbi:hypothetical protein [Paraburkholderia youngii]|uniref:hypothetical protein n=1 Tax=Paraburkholderia youngii TaxID=2782701 RepID=UPI003D202E0E
MQFAQGPDVKPTQDAAYWDRVTVGFDFDEGDRAAPAQYNKVMWSGITGKAPYPVPARSQDPV